MKGWISIGSRGCGRTTALVEAAKKIDATFVCHDEEFARSVSRSYGVKTTSIRKQPFGQCGPYIFDHAATDALMLEYERRIGDMLEALIAAEAYITDEIGCSTGPGTILSDIRDVIRKAKGGGA